MLTLASSPFGTEGRGCVEKQQILLSNAKTISLSLVLLQEEATVVSVWLTFKLLPLCWTCHYSSVTFL